MKNNRIASIKEALVPFRNTLANHPVYTHMTRPQDVVIFMQNHIFAVWDFMSLLKSLQRGLTGVEIPWQPVGNPIIRRLINQIVVEEESDETQDGGCLSHFELYREAMSQCGAGLEAIDQFLERLRGGMPVPLALQGSLVPAAAREFVGETWRVIESGAIHRIAASFTFGREEVIPAMFVSVVRDLDQKFSGQFGTFRYYLERHIELDGDTHSVLACQMMEEMCGDDEAKWAECEETSKAALVARCSLWNGILDQIKLRSEIAVPEEEPQLAATGPWWTGVTRPLSMWMKR